MSDQEFVIELDRDATEGSGMPRGIVKPNEREWLENRIRRDGATQFRLVAAHDEDTEGHGALAVLHLIVEDDDDTEGHAIAVHFPTRADADAARKRLLLTGALVGTIALGAVGGVGLANLASSDAGSTGAVSGQYSTENMGGTIVAPETGQYSTENMGGTIVAPEAVGPMDAHEAPAFQAAAAAEGLPMDVHEAPAFQAGASGEDTDDEPSEPLVGPR